MSLPLEGELRPARQKKFRETIVFVHHFGGSKKTLLRHVRLVNEFGFDAVVFNLLHHDSLFSGASSWRDLVPIAPRGFGVVHVWSAQIQSVLESVAGEKIVYSFSMPSNAAVEAIRGRSDIRALICDGGPFLQLPLCTWNLLKHEFHVRNLALRSLLTAVSLPFFGGFWRSLDGLPPVLSLRGGRDPLVPVSAINAFFGSLRVETVLFPEAGHLDAIKVAPGEYRRAVSDFLAGHATRL